MGSDDEEQQPIESSQPGPSSSSQNREVREEESEPIVRKEEPKPIERMKTAIEKVSLSLEEYKLLKTEHKPYDPHGEGLLFTQIEPRDTFIDLTPLNGEAHRDEPDVVTVYGKKTTDVLDAFAERIGGTIEYEGVTKVIVWLTMPVSRLYTIAEGVYKETLILHYKKSVHRQEVDDDDESDIKTFVIGVGRGLFKSVSSMRAARNTLWRFVPGLEVGHDCTCMSGRRRSALPKIEIEARKLFRRTPIEWPHVVEVCQRFRVASPVELLRLALDASPNWDRSDLEYEEGESDPETGLVTVRLKLGDMSAVADTAESTELWRAMDEAALPLLQKLHPGLRYYGSLLEIYERPDADDDDNNHNNVVPRKRQRVVN